MMTKTSALAAAVLTAFGHLAHVSPAGADDLDAVLATRTRAAAPGRTGKPLIDLRYRYEYVGDDATAFAARASTVRAALGYQTRSLLGFSATGQLAAVGALAHDFYRVPTSPTQNNMAYPTVLDPTGLTLAQLYARFEAPWLTVKVGRQELGFNDQRFLGADPWRQLHRTFDAASVVARPLPGVSIQYALTGRINRVSGPSASDGQEYLIGHLVNARYQRPGLGALALYDLRLDFLEDSARSTNTLGARVEGPLRLDGSWSILYAAEFARQTETAHNPNRFAASYYLVEAGAAFRGLSARIRYNVREGSGALDKLTTPLAQPWDGWSEKFADTPDAGLRTWSLAIAGAVPRVRGLSASLAYHDSGAQSTGAHYGSELDAGVEYRLLGLDAHWTAGSHVSFYKADALFADTLRMSVYTAYDF